MSIAALTEWLAGKGAEFPCAAVDHERGSRLVRATADIRERDVVVRVPLAALLTLDIARRSATGEALLRKGLESRGGHCLLATFLLAEKRRGGSSFAPYLDALPAAFPNVPLFCQKGLIPVLRGSLVGALIARRTDMLRRDFMAVRRAVPILHDMSLHEFFWARTAVITRVFGLTIGGVATEALVPLADMMNHRRPPDVDWSYDDAAGAFLMRASRDIAKGEEICDSYGRKPNGRFFVHYGFALPSCADDEADVRLSLSRDDPRASVKAEALSRNIGESGSYRISNMLRGDDTLRTFSFLRAACAGEREMPKVLRLLAEDRQIDPLSARNEVMVLARLDNACAESLARFASPVQDEEEALGRADLPQNLRHALLVIRGEKRLLLAYRRLAAQAIPLLRLPSRSFFTAAAQYTGDALTANYLLDTALALAPREARPPSFRSIGL
jgi:protein-histidine N-methyltransferase